METSPSNKIADKIQKLLALAQGNTTEAEADAAMQKVQELLASYNLTMDEVGNLANHGKNNGESNGKRTKDKVEKCAMYEYQRRLMAQIAQSHYCLHWVSSTKKVSKSGRYVNYFYHIVVGREANVITTKLMFDYLNSTIERLAMVEYPVPYNLSKSAISWKTGCADRLIRRLQIRSYEQDQASEKKCEEARAADPNTTLPSLHVVRSTETDLNRDFAWGYEPGTTARQRAQWEEAQKNHQAKVEDTETPAEKAKREKANKKFWERWEREQQRKRDAMDWNAYDRGHEKGDTVGLDTQVNETKRRQLS